MNLVKMSGLEKDQFLQLLFGKTFLVFSYADILTHSKV